MLLIIRVKNISSFATVQPYSFVLSVFQVQFAFLHLCLPSLLWVVLRFRNERSLSNLFLCSPQEAHEIIFGLKGRLAFPPIFRLSFLQVGLLGQASIWKQVLISFQKELPYSLRSSTLIASEMRFSRNMDFFEFLRVRFKHLKTLQSLV